MLERTACRGRTGPAFPDLALIAASIYTLFGAFQSETSKARGICTVVTLGLWACAYLLYRGMDDPRPILPQEFQQFNPFFVVALTPVSMAIFGALAKKDKEPSAPKKIGLGIKNRFITAATPMSAAVAQAAPMIPSHGCATRVQFSITLATAAIIMFTIGMDG